MADIPQSMSGIDNLLVLAAEAKAGRLVLDPDVARDCAAACKELIAELETAHLHIQQLDFDLPLGDFHCGHQTAKLLRDVAGEFKQRLEEHIDAVKAIHDMVGAQVSQHLTTDEQTSQALAAAGGRIGG